MQFVRSGGEKVNLLIDERPLIVLPKLAKEIGLNEAIMLQQIHFWMNKKKNVIDGISWVYNTYDGWAKQFPFWSKSTIRRTINSLEKQNLLITGNHNKMKLDNTKWYSINYEQLERVSRPSAQNEQTMCSKWTDGSVQNEQTNTIDNTENTTYIYSVFEHWNTKQIIRHRKLNQKTKSHINARLSEYSADELKKAIDNYKDILEGDQYYWTHKWTLEDFMKPNNVIRFLDEAEPKKNFLKSGVPVVEEEQEQTKDERIAEIKETLALGEDYFLMVDGNLNEYNKLKKELRKLERI